MSPEILIVGQGLAGTLLAWELDRAGVPFTIADAGHGRAASRVAAGVINPITGQRIAKSWRVDTLLPLARETYRTIEREWGLSLWRDMRVRRFYLNEDERRVLAEKQARGELADYAVATDGDGFWVEGAARVDIAELVRAARARWIAEGRLRQENIDIPAVRPAYGLVIDCTGASGSPFGFVPWQYSKGECLTLAVDGLAPDVVLNRGHWILPLQPGRAMVGATHSPGRRDIILTAEARTALEASIATMSSQPFLVTEHDAGVRAYVPDKRPIVGRHPGDPGLGVLNALGAKGALFAPALARQWLNHLVDGVPFDRETDVARFWRRQPVLTPSLAAVVQR